jgi:hypothetical protein
MSVDGDTVTKPAHPQTQLGRGPAKALATRKMLGEVAADLFAEEGYVQTSRRRTYR